MIDILRNIPTLQLFSELSNKNIRIFICPYRQCGIINLFLILSQTIVIIIFIDEHLRQGVNLWNELSYVSCACSCVFPRAAITVKDAVSTIKLSTLESQCTDTVWPNPDEKVEDYCRA
jgi:hypothetical protein